MIARLAARVVSVEIWPDLADETRRHLEADGIGNVTVLVGDGTEDASDHAPFDAIVVSAAFTEVPPPLVVQLRTGGGPGRGVLSARPRRADAAAGPHARVLRPPGRPVRFPARVSQYRIMPRMFLPSRMS
ncbi:hypothetical protein Acsp03_55560 [Actinomadura sp. NBRC 104412]|nr:hypothetical protein Acsp03_55560 [Actinomadura sp. NBRC 104412]